MMIKKLLLGIFTSVLLATPAATVSAAPSFSAPVTTFAACPARLLTLPAWYRGLKGDTECNPTIQALGDVWIIAFNIIEMMMQAVAYVSAGFIMWGGFRYMIATGEPDKISSAKSTIEHAVVGLVIALVAVGAINFISSFLV